MTDSPGEKRPFNPDLAQAHLALAEIAMPGEDYLAWLERIYRELKPDTVIEIGVYRGASLALIRPPAIAIGIDPNPRICHTLRTETHIFAETSDEFFAKRRADKFLADRPLSIGFVDGLHLYEQALKDFINLEFCCGPQSVILLHDTVPFDERTQTRAQETQFHTGDVWKTVLSLKHYRPDLDILTIATSPTGLTVVMGLNPRSRVLAERYEEAVTRFIDTPFSAIEGRLDGELNIVPNDWRAVAKRLQAHGIIKDSVH